MMKKIKKYFNIIMPLILACSSLLSCTESGEPDTREGSVTLSFSTGAPITRAGDGDVSDGGGIKVTAGEPELYVAIVNYVGDIVAKYPSTDSSSDCLEASATQATIRFNGFTSFGAYTVYAVANTSGLWTMNSTLDAATTASDLESLVFQELAGTSTPAVSGAMPLSAKGTLMVNESLNGQADLDLLRCVGKVGYKFKNETDGALTLSDCVVTIHGINQSSGYLFSHTPDAAGSPRDLSFNKSSIVIPAGESTELYEMSKVFPSTAPEQSVGSRYLCDISFTLSGSAKSYTGLPIHDKKSQDIPALQRNQYLQIETRINRGMNISFNFEVSGWDTLSEEIFFH